MTLFGFLNHWWNLPFLVMLGLVVVFFVLQVVGILGHDADHDHEVDHDHDVDADHDHDADGDADGDGEGDAWHEVLAFFGVGRVPFMVVWVTLFIFAGLSGIFLNSWFFTRSAGDYRGWHFAIVMLVSFFIGLLAVRLFSRMAARFVDTGGKGSTAKHELVGKLGVVASPQCDGKFGEIRVRDPRGGDEILVHGRLQGEEKPLAHGAQVVMVDYDSEKELFWVTACPEADKRG